ncbi:MAG: hypothetical protein SOR72_06315 [Hornefia sp.]|nr:hypothetical protein [Hornefia sp.]
MTRFLDLKGRKFGKLTAACRIESKEKGYAKWLCKCDCGEETVCTARDLKKGYVKSCGCMKRKKNRWYRDIKEKQFGRLVALYPTLNRNAKGSILWKCLCDCGNNCYVSEDTLVNGSTKSCGCSHISHLAVPP